MYFEGLEHKEWLKSTELKRRYYSISLLTNYTFKFILQRDKSIIFE